jgi:hypothetical protein
VAPRARAAAAVGLLSGALLLLGACDVDPRSPTGARIDSAELDTDGEPAPLDPSCALPGEMRPCGTAPAATSSSSPAPPPDGVEVCREAAGTASWGACEPRPECWPGDLAACEGGEMPCRWDGQAWRWDRRGCADT